MNDYKKYKDLQNLPNDFKCRFKLQLKFKKSHKYPYDYIKLKIDYHDNILIQFCNDYSDDCNYIPEEYMLNEILPTVLDESTIKTVQLLHLDKLLYDYAPTPFDNVNILDYDISHSDKCVEFTMGL